MMNASSDRPAVYFRYANVGTIKFVCRIDSVSHKIVGVTVFNKCSSGHNKQRAQKLRTKPYDSFEEAAQAAVDQAVENGSSNENHTSYVQLLQAANAKFAASAAGKHQPSLAGGAAGPTQQGVQQQQQQQQQQGAPQHVAPAQSAAAAAAAAGLVASLQQQGAQLQGQAAPQRTPSAQVPGSPAGISALPAVPALPGASAPPGRPLQQSRQQQIQALASPPAVDALSEALRLYSLGGTTLSAGAGSGGAAVGAAGGAAAQQAAGARAAPAATAEGVREGGGSSSQQVLTQRCDFAGPLSPQMNWSTNRPVLGPSSVPNLSASVAGAPGYGGCCRNEAGKENAGLSSLLAGLSIGDCVASPLHSSSSSSVAKVGADSSLAVAGAGSSVPEKGPRRRWDKPVKQEEEERQEPCWLTQCAASPSGQHQQRGNGSTPGQPSPQQQRKRAWNSSTKLS